MWETGPLSTPNPTSSSDNECIPLGLECLHGQTQHRGCVGATSLYEAYKFPRAARSEVRHTVFSSNCTGQVYLGHDRQLNENGIHQQTGWHRLAETLCIGTGTLGSLYSNGDSPGCLICARVPQCTSRLPQQGWGSLDYEWELNWTYLALVFHKWEFLEVYVFAELKIQIILHKGGGENWSH